MCKSEVCFAEVNLLRTVLIESQMLHVQQLPTTLLNASLNYKLGNPVTLHKRILISNYVTKIVAKNNFMRISDIKSGSNM